MSTPENKLLSGKDLVTRAIEIGVSLNGLYDSNGVMDEPELQRRVLQAELYLSETGVAKGPYNTFFDWWDRIKNKPFIAPVAILIVVALSVFAVYQMFEYVMEKKQGPIVISPSEIELKASPKGLSGGWNIPAEITVKNSSKDNLYSVWVCFYLSEANLNPIDIAIVSESDKAHPEFNKLYKITRNYIDSETGSAKFVFSWKPLEKHDFKRAAIYLEATVADGKKRAYIGIKKLLPGETRLFQVRINYGDRKQKEYLPIKLTSFEHKHSTWLQEQKQKAHLDVILPDAESIMEPMSMRLLDVGPT